MSNASSSRLLTLDALRGTGSLAVVLYHLGFAGTFAGKGYLAVDFFFLMSGVVITRAYQTKIQRGMTITGFMTERVIRFYPFYILGLSLGLVRRIMQIMTDHPQAMSWPDLITSTLTNALMLPAPLTNEVTPLNVATWSLLLELLINVIWAFWLVKLSRRGLLVCLAASACVFGAMVVHQGSSGGGALWKDIHMGMVRGFFGFVMGVTLANFVTPRRPRESVFAVCAVGVLLTLFVVDIAPGHQVVHDLLCVFVLFPCVMYVALAFDPPRSLGGVARFLGDVSFPVYTLHFGLLYVFLYVAKKLGFQVGVGPGLWIPVFLVLVLTSAIVLARTYDPVARRWLRELMARRRARLAPTT